MVSVIIPVWNDAAYLEILLKRLATEPGQLEIIVVDGGSRDGIVETVESFPDARLLHSARGRGRQMNAGARAARGEALLFLHADTCPPKGAVAELPGLLESTGADFGAFQMRFDPPLAVIRFLALFTRFASPWCCFGDQGIFVRRDFFWSTGGFPEISLLEDVHWVRLAGQLGSMTRSPRTVITSARRFQKIGAFRQSARNAMILLRDLAGEEPAKLAKIYGRERPREEHTAEATRLKPKREAVAESVSAERA